jgi:Na+-driven multidrug efflux pump
VLLIALRGPIVTLLDPSNPETTYLAKQMLLIASIQLPLRQLPFILVVGIFRTGGRPKVAVVIDLGCAPILASCRNHSLISSMSSGRTAGALPKRFMV